MPAEFDIVEMLGLTNAEDADQLVLAAVEAALASVRLYPDHQVQHLAIDLTACLDQLADMAPVHADEMDRAVAGDAGGSPERLLEKGGELGARHLA